MTDKHVRVVHRAGPDHRCSICGEFVRATQPDNYVLGGWPIDVAEVTRDVDRRFSPDGEEVVLANRGFQMFLDEALLGEAGYDRSGVAAFLRAYTMATMRRIAQPPAAERDKKVFLTALTYPELKACLRDD